MQLDLQVWILQADAKLAQERAEDTLSRERGRRLVAGVGAAHAGSAACTSGSHIAAVWRSWDYRRTGYVDACVVFVLVEIYKRIETLKLGASR